MAQPGSTSTWPQSAWISGSTSGQRIGSMMSSVRPRGGAVVGEDVLVADLGMRAAATRGEAIACFAPDELDEAVVDDVRHAVALEHHRDAAGVVDVRMGDDEEVEGAARDRSGARRTRRGSRAAPRCCRSRSFSSPPVSMRTAAQGNSRSVASPCPTSMKWARIVRARRPGRMRRRGVTADDPPQATRRARKTARRHMPRILPESRVTRPESRPRGRGAGARR